MVDLCLLAQQVKAEELGQQDMALVMARVVVQVMAEELDQQDMALALARAKVRVQGQLMA